LNPASQDRSSADSVKYLTAFLVRDLGRPRAQPGQLRTGQISDRHHGWGTLSTGLCILPVAAAETHRRADAEAALAQPSA
jgi:hypothetical protein